MNIVVPLDLTDAQARTLMTLYEALIDSLIEFYTALGREYPLAELEPEHAEPGVLLEES